MAFLLAICSLQGAARRSCKPVPLLQCLDMICTCNRAFAIIVFSCNGVLLRTIFISENNVHINKYEMSYKSTMKFCDYGKKCVKITWKLADLSQDCK